jgi:hypothetical protein
MGLVPNTPNYNNTGDGWMGRSGEEQDKESGAKWKWQKLKSKHERFWPTFGNESRKG